MYDNIIIHDSTSNKTYLELQKLVSEIKQKYCIFGEFHVLIKDDPANGPNIEMKMVDLNPKKWFSKRTEVLIITKGILENFSPITNADELKALLAHEFSHTLHKDIKFKGITGVVIGLIDLILLDILLQTNQNLIIIIVTVILMIIVSFRVFYHINRKLETRCDEEAYCKTQNREALKNAIKKVGYLGTQNRLGGVIHCIIGYSHPSDEERSARIDSLTFN
jgi:Zn-dependent protease with chaperone function